MAMKIGNTISGYYNPDRIDPSGQAQRVERTEKINGIEGSRNVISQPAKENPYSGRENRALVRTQVSPENSFQKAMVNDPSFAIERMAAKLFDKLPKILEDMRNLPEESGIDVAAAAKQADMQPKTEKVVISEDGRIRGQVAGTPETENISL